MVETGTRGKGQGVCYSSPKPRFPEHGSSDGCWGLKVTDGERRLCETALPQISLKWLPQLAALAVRRAPFLTSCELNTYSLCCKRRLGENAVDKPRELIQPLTPHVIKSKTKSSRWVAAEAGSLWQNL